MYMYMLYVYVYMYMFIYLYIHMDTPTIWTSLYIYTGKHQRDRRRLHTALQVQSDDSARQGLSIYVNPYIGKSIYEVSLYVCIFI